MNIQNIKFNKFNYIYGIYLDKLNNEKIYIIFGNDENTIYIINIKKYLLSFTLDNFETQEKNGLYYTFNINDLNKNFNISN